MAPNGCDLKGPVMTLPPFPTTRLRRLRATPALRSMVRESALSPADFIWPVFVMDGTDAEEPIPSMPGVVRRTVDRIGAAAREAYAMGIPAICIFPYTTMDARTEDCALAWSPDNVANRAIAEIKKAAPDIAVMTDIALDPYNINGHDGFVENGEIVNGRYLGAVGYDGRAYRRDPHSIRTGWPPKGDNPELYREICIRVLWSVSRRRRRIQRADRG